MMTLLTWSELSSSELDVLWLSNSSLSGVTMQYWQLINNDFELAMDHPTRLAYLVFENLAEVFDTVAEVLLQEQQDVCICGLDSLLVGLSIVAFAKTLAPNCKLVNRSHVLRRWQIINGTNQLFCPRNERGRDMPWSAMTPMLEYQYLQAGTFCGPFLQCKYEIRPEWIWHTQYRYLASCFT